MPFIPQHSLLRVDVPALRSVDTYSAEDLFGMWSLFSRTSNAMEEGKRLENLSWRLWNRETFCCDARPRRQSRSRASAPQCPSIAAAATEPDSRAPSLSLSVDSASSDDLIPPAVPADLNLAHPQKHITPDDLANMVDTINQTRALEPIELLVPGCDDLTRTASATSTSTHTATEAPVMLVTAATQSLDFETPSTSANTSFTATTESPASSRTHIESSTSTVATVDEDASTIGSDISSHTGTSTHSTHSVVRGFAPSSYRSQTNLAAAVVPILKNSPQYLSKPKKAAAKFTIGTSSGEDESSFENHMYRSTLSQSLQQQAGSGDSARKHTSFSDNVSVGTAARPAEHSPVFESDDEDEDVSESAIEDDDDDDDVDDDSSDWEDSEDQSRPSSVNEKELFQRVDSRPNLTSRRSLLTTLMHEPDRAKHFANAASRSTPALRRSRGATPNGPSVATSPVQEQLQTSDSNTVNSETPGARPIIMTTSNHAFNPGYGRTSPLALSPRTTRRNMLSTELTESLRKNLLWERQHRSHGNLAALKRRHTSHDVKNLRQHPEPGPYFKKGPAGADGQLVGSEGRAALAGDDDGVSRVPMSEWFSQGLGEFHAKGW